MDKLRIGIPKALHYFHSGVFWLCFFKKLNIETIVSPDTNKEILSRGIFNSPDEMCLSMKIYLGHIDYLKDRCDYILVPRIDRYDDDNQTCSNFLASYDLVKYLFDIKTLHYNIDNHHDLLDGMIEVGKSLDIDKWKIIDAYDCAKEEEKKYYEEKYLEQEKKLLDRNKKVLIVAHAYNTHDKFIGGQVVDLLNKNGIGVIYSNNFNNQLTNRLSSRLSKNLYWKYSKDKIGAIELSNQVDGIIFLSTFPCGLDSLVNELVMRKITKPYLNIIVDDLTSLSGLETRIESFVDLFG